MRTNPIVYDGMMYVTNSNTVYALDARTGRQVWIYTDARAKKPGVNRGAAILGDRLFLSHRMSTWWRWTGAMGT